MRTKESIAISLFILLSSVSYLFGSPVPIGEVQSIRLIAVMPAWYEFGFYEDRNLNNLIEDGSYIDADLENHPLYIGYKTNSSTGVDLLLEATPFNTENGHENTQFALNSDNGTLIPSGETGKIAAGDLVNPTFPDLRQKYSRITYAQYSEPDFSSAPPGKYFATLTLTIIPQ